jgi:hypothetical protein
MTCRATSEKLSELKLPKGFLKNLAAEASSEEKEWLSTSVGIIAWIARSCRPTLSYNVSKLQGRSRKPLVGDIKICNQVIRYTLATSECGIGFHHGLDWSSMIIGYVGDASFAEEDQPNDFTRELEPHWSQGGQTIILASEEIIIWHSRPCQLRLSSARKKKKVFTKAI